MISFYILIFILGAVIGSFLNVVIFRLKKKQSIFKKRSHCLFCKRKLTWYELFPIFSFIFQGGKCLGCGKKFSWQYPLVEFFTGLLFLLGFIFQPPIYGFASIIFCAFLLTIFCFLIIIFVYDLKYYLVADEIIYSAIILALSFNFFLWFDGAEFEVFLSAIIASLIAGGFFLTIVLLSKGKWMGMGDVKIGLLMGLILGWPQILVALFIAFFVGAIVSAVLLALKRKKLKSRIPFGPFLALATIITIFFGNILLRWYLGLM